MSKKYLIYFLLLFSTYTKIHGQNLNFENFENSIGVIRCFDFNNNYIGHGSCFIIDSNGLFITNYHVLKNVYKATIHFSSGKNFSLKKIISANEEIDLVIFSVNKKNANDNFVPIEIASELPKKGEAVWAIGTPHHVNFINTISNGIVSNIHNETNGRIIIQTNAEITHGSSGGALLNSKGQVIGVTSGGIDDENGDGARANINFAIWINEYKKLENTNLERIYDDKLIPIKVLFYTSKVETNEDILIYIDGKMAGFLPTIQSTVDCDNNVALKISLLIGSHNFTAYKTSTKETRYGTFSIFQNTCFVKEINFDESSKNVTSVPKIRNNCFKNNDILLNGGLGFPLTQMYLPNSKFLGKVNYIPTISIQFEHPIKFKNLGLGLNSSYLNFRNTNTYTSIYDLNTYTYTQSWKVLFLMGVFSYHRDLFNSKNKEMYIGVALGGSIRLSTYETNDPRPENKNAYKIANSFAYPAYSLFAGARWYFAKNVGVFGEVGYGISYLTGGLSFKF